MDEAARCAVNRDLSYWETLNNVLIYSIARYILIQTPQATQSSADQSSVL